MKEQIHNLRIRIDGLSQLVKELKSFEWNIYEVDVPKEMNGFTSFLYRVMTSLSISPNDNAKFHGIIHTDKGTFRCASWIKEEIQLFNIDFKSKEINKCYDSLILAKAWLGKILRALGEETPYKNDGKRKTIEDIEETNDKAEVLCTTGLEGIATNQTWEEKNYIEKIDWLRQEIQNIIKIYPNWIKYYEEQKKLILPPNRDLENDFQRFNKEIDNIIDFNSEAEFVKQHLSEARFWLGFDLQRNKENNV